MSFKLIEEANFTGESVSLNQFEGASSGIIKLFVSGQLQALGVGRALMMQVNGMTSGYKTYGFSQGDYLGTETEPGGFYLGRSGYGVDATFLLELTVAKVPSAHQIICNGLSTFAHIIEGNKLLCFECHSAIPTNQPIQNINLFFKGGIPNGIVRAYQV